MDAKFSQHRCADEMWRHVKSVGQVEDCSCGRIFKQVPLSWWRMLNPLQRRVPALGGELWVDVTRRELERRRQEELIRERAARSHGYITGEPEVLP